METFRGPKASRFDSHVLCHNRPDIRVAKSDPGEEIFYFKFRGFRNYGINFGIQTNLKSNNIG